jgi:hypothetical protein
MGAMSSRDERQQTYKHAVEFLDTRTENYMPGYEDDHKKRGYLAEAAFVYLSLASHGTYETLLNEVLNAHGIDRTRVAEVRLDYKPTVSSTVIVRITTGTLLDEIIKNPNVVLVFRVLKWTPDLRTQKLKDSNFGDMKPGFQTGVNVVNQGDLVPIQQAHPPPEHPLHSQYQQHVPEEDDHAHRSQTQQESIDQPLLSVPENGSEKH